jgi:hypothetical protein
MMGKIMPDFINDRTMDWNIIALVSVATFG